MVPSCGKYRLHTEMFGDQIRKLERFESKKDQWRTRRSRPNLWKTFPIKSAIVTETQCFCDRKSQSNNTFRQRSTCSANVASWMDLDLTIESASVRRIIGGGAQ